MGSRTRGPNPLRALRSAWRASRRRRPRPAGAASFDHRAFAPVLSALARDGLTGASRHEGDLAAYRVSLAGTDPDQLGRAEALAFWINLYNAEALAAALAARSSGLDSMLRWRDVFDRPRVRVAAERLSLDDIEHGKIRRFHDPRVHAVLTCGSLSCPSVPAEPLRGNSLDRLLEDGMRRFLRRGGIVPDRESCEVALSRIFLWYGTDFVHPEAMPRWRPVSRRAVLESLTAWLPPPESRWIRESRPRVRFLPYDWSLSCRAAQSEAASTLSAGTDTRTTPRKSPAA